MRMPRSSETHRDALTQSLARSYSSEDMDHTESHSVSAGGTVLSGRGQGHGGTAGRSGARRWSVVVLSVLGSAVAVTAAGCFCALIYPILRELRAERVRGQDGTEQRMLGFWSVLVLSVLAGCLCCVFSWTLTYLNSQKPGPLSPALTLTHLRDVSAHGFHLGYGVAVLNGVMALLTVVWSLT
ncbi:ADP-ribosylation factor-like protein 6-interacting protein 6 [Symphorus nematophorus]